MSLFKKGDAQNIAPQLTISTIKTFADHFICASRVHNLVKVFQPFSFCATWEYQPRERCDWKRDDACFISTIEWAVCVMEIKWGFYLCERHLFIDIRAMDVVVASMRFALSVSCVSLALFSDVCFPLQRRTLSWWCTRRRGIIYAANLIGRMDRCVVCVDGFARGASESYTRWYDPLNTQHRVDWRSHLMLCCAVCVYRRSTVHGITRRIRLACWMDGGVMLPTYMYALAQWLMMCFKWAVKRCDYDTLLPHGWSVGVSLNDTNRWKRAGCGGG